MKLIPAIFFTAVGIWLAYNKPELAEQAYQYILLAIEYVKTFLNGVLK